MFDSWIFYVCVFIVFQVVYLQLFKYLTKDTKNIGALTVSVQLISAISILVFAPFFDWKWPSGSDAWLTWILFSISFVLFAFNDRLDDISRKNMDISIDTTLHQIYRLLFIPCLVLVLGRPFRMAALIGGVIIVLANMLMLFDKGKFKMNKFVYIKLIAVVLFVIALTLQMKVVPDFNPPFFVFLSFSVPAAVLLLTRQATPKSVAQEFSRPKRWLLILAGIAQGITTLAWFLATLPSVGAYSMHVSAISASYVLLNTIFAFIFLKERKNLTLKIIASVIIVASLVLIATAPLFS